MRRQRPDLEPTDDLLPEAGLEKVGGRRRIRGEVIFAILGALFIVGAVAKPWSNGDVASTVGRPSGGASAGPAAGPPGADPVASPAVAGSADASGSQEPFALFGQISARWSGVDWSLLATADRHVGWGVGTASLPNLTFGPLGGQAPKPTAGWVAATPGSIVTVPVPSGQRVFALAITWPSRVRVSRIVYEYDGDQNEPPYVSSGGFPPYTQLSPLAAINVLDPANRLAGGDLLRSGQYWVPPAEASTNAYSRSAAWVWRRMPWSWPAGQYKITATTDGGQVLLVVRIQSA
jgi:hypothetical protein